VPDEVRDDLTFVFADKVDDVLTAALSTPASTTAGTNGHQGSDQVH